MATKLAQLLWVSLLVVACTRPAPAAPQPAPPTAAGPTLTACEAAMQRAASFSDIDDQVGDLDPAIEACASLAEFAAAGARFPAALDGADAAGFAANRCRSNEDLAESPICQAIEE